MDAKISKKLSDKIKPTALLENFEGRVSKLQHMQPITSRDSGLPAEGGNYWAVFSPSISSKLQTIFWQKSWH